MFSEVLKYVYTYYSLIRFIFAKQEIIKITFFDTFFHLVIIDTI